MTHMCVNSTARDAFNLGYRPTVVASATATRELPVSGARPCPPRRCRPPPWPASLTCSRWWPARPTTSPADRTLERPRTYVRASWLAYSDVPRARIRTAAATS